jgi:hypothetical protein
MADPKKLAEALKSSAPKTWYHGADEKFDQFDAEKIKRGSQGQGVYLTPDASQAKLAGRHVAKVHADVSSPMQARGADHAAEQLGVEPEHFLSMKHDELADALRSKGFDAIQYGGGNMVVPPDQTKIVGWK